MSKKIMAALAVSGLLSYGGASAQVKTDPALGKKLAYTGGDITIKVMPATAGYTSVLALYQAAAPGAKVLKAVGTNKEVGKVVTIKATELATLNIKVGVEIFFGINVTNTGYTYFMGPGSRNPDGIAHAKVTQLNATSANVGFEDLHGGGDRDYDDNVFNFAGGVRFVDENTPIKNMPPDCSHAVPSMLELWPPNHSMHEISISGCKDPENNPITIQILRIMQDEPVMKKGAGAGNTAADAIIGTNGKFQVRAERNGNGDSRVYFITFTAKDSAGNTSAETVISVAVPKQPKQETIPKSTKTLYDSTKAATK